jgi:hypothetical protein
MSYFVTPSNSYYEGDRASALDVAVPQRPDPTYVWDGVQWAADAAKQAAAARLAADVQELRDFITDPSITSLINQTKAQWLSWAGTNFPTLTAAERNRLGTLFWVVSIGVRGLMRA